VELGKEVRMGERLREEKECRRNNKNNNGV
jgi:hypothetical protein